MDAIKDFGIDADTVYLGALGLSDVGSKACTSMKPTMAQCWYSTKNGPLPLKLSVQMR
jgi:hypothetical protein